jgi:hypothetical protein
MMTSILLTDNSLIDPRGPIESFEWGRFTIDGISHEKGVNAGKNLRIIGSEVSNWEEFKTGLDHHISIQKITGLPSKGIEVLIFGIGVNGVVRTDSNVLDYVGKEFGIKEIIIEKTPKACLNFNNFYEMGRKVAMFVHGTC